jgi:hypothetical protein
LFLLSCNKNVYRVYKHEDFPPIGGIPSFDKIVLYKDSTYKSEDAHGCIAGDRHQGIWEHKNDTIKLYWLPDFTSFAFFKDTLSFVDTLAASNGLLYKIIGFKDSRAINVYNQYLANFKKTFIFDSIYFVNGQLLKKIYPSFGKTFLIENKNYIPTVYEKLYRNDYIYKNHAFIYGEKIRRRYIYFKRALYFGN